MKRPRSSAEHDARGLGSRLPLSDAGALRASPQGEPLPRSLAHLFKPEEQGRIASVRLHQGPASTAAARRERADAFVNDGHIHFADGAFRPSSPEGARLLNHELAHVALGHEGLNRQQAPGTAPRTIADLTNAEFIAAAAASPADGGYGRDEIDTERARRVGLGHEWLRDATAQSPARLVVAVPQASGVESVHEADLRVVLGTLVSFLPARVMTPAQLQRLLDRRGIGTVLASQFYGQAPTVGGLAQGGRRPNLPYSIVEPGQVPASLQDLIVPVVRDSRYSALVYHDAPPSTWRGAANSERGPYLTVGEIASAQNSSNIRRLLLSSQNGTPMVLGLDDLGLVDSYVVGTRGTGGVGRILLGERILRVLAAGRTTHYLKVNPNARPLPGAGETEVELFHRRIHEAAQRQGKPPRSGEGYSLNQHEMARVALEFAEPILTPELRRALTRIAAGEVAAVAELPPMMERLSAHMQLLARATATLDPAYGQFDARTLSGRLQISFLRAAADPRTPEFYAAQRYGGNAAAFRGGAYGAGLGFLLALPVDAAVRGATGQGYGDFWDRAPQTMATGTFGGGLAGVSNQLMVSGTSNALLNQGVGIGLAGASRLAFARAIPGGIGAAGAELLSMAAFEDREHSAREVVLRTGRAGGMGAVSTVAGSILGAAATGAVAGSVAPVVGNAIGFVAGLVTGVVVYVVLDRALPQVDRTP